MLNPSIYDQHYFAPSERQITFSSTNRNSKNNVEEGSEALHIEHQFQKGSCLDTVLETKGDQVLTSQPSNLSQDGVTPRDILQTDSSIKQTAAQLYSATSQITVTSNDEK